MAGVDGARRRPDELGFRFPVDLVGERKRERTEAMESEMGTSSPSYPREQAGREEVAARRRPRPSGARRKKKKEKKFLQKTPWVSRKLQKQCKQAPGSCFK